LSIATSLNPMADGTIAITASVAVLMMGTALPELFAT